MSSIAHRITGVVLGTILCYFAVLTAASWIFTFCFQEHFDYLFWERLLQPSGEIILPLAFIASLIVGRWNRLLAVVGWLSCLMWMVWAFFAEALSYDNHVF